MPLPQAETLTFRKSSYSDRNNCVEVANTPGTAAIRDSQHPGSAHLTFSSSEWTALLTTTRRTEAHHA